MKTVKEIYDYFLEGILNGEGARSLMGFMNTIPGFHTKGQDKAGSMNVSLGMEYYRICEKMADDLLLLKTKPNTVMPFMSEYVGVSSVNSSIPEAFDREIAYGGYDFKYRGFAYTYNFFKDSVVPIVGINAIGDQDNGTAYYIGNNYFVTAAHCVTGLQKFNLLKPDNSTYKLKEVWLASGQDLDTYDLAIIVVDEKPTCPSLWLGRPTVLDEILTMGYPPIPGINPLLTAETATIATYDKIQRKAVVGQVVGNANTYFNDLEYFLISARVKGGNSGGPVINNTGKVVGTVIQLPFDNEGGFKGKRFDIMGFGVCLPSKYTEDLLATPDIKVAIFDNGYFRLK